MLESGPIQIESGTSPHKGGNYGEKYCEDERAQPALGPSCPKQNKSVAAEPKDKWQNKNGQIRISPRGMCDCSGTIAQPSKHGLRNKDRNDCHDGLFHF